MFLISFTSLLLLFGAGLSSAYGGGHGSPGGGCFNQNLAKWRQGFEEWQHEFEKWKENNDGCPTPTGPPPSTTTSGPFSTQPTSAGTMQPTTIPTPTMINNGATYDICNQTVIAAQPGVTNYLTSPNYPNLYGSNENCTISVTAPPGRVIHLLVLFIQMDRCCDFLHVHDERGSTRLLYEPYTTASNSATLRFTSDETVNQRGFHLSITVIDPPPPTNHTVPPTNHTAAPPTNHTVPPTNHTVPPTNHTVPPTNHTAPTTEMNMTGTTYDICTYNDALLNATSYINNLTSPSYPNPYPETILCDLVISAPSHLKIKIEVVRIDVAPFDFLIFETISGHEVIAPIHNTTTPPEPFLTSSNLLTVRFSSQAPDQMRTGFLLSFRAMAWSDPAP